MGRISRRSIGVFMPVAMATSWAATQENDQPLAMFFAPVDVPLVSVEVYVSDRSGHPVRGLTLDDFEIFEDGKKVEISHFYASPGVSAVPQEEEEQEVETSDVDFVEAGPAQDLYASSMCSDSTRAKDGMTEVGTRSGSEWLARAPMSGHHGGMWITDKSCSLLAISYERLPDRIPRFSKEGCLEGMASPAGAPAKS